MRAWRMRILVSTWMAYAGLYFCRKAFYVLKGTLADELGFTVAELAEIGTAYLLAYAIGQFVAAGLGPRTGARLLLLTGIATSLTTNIVFGLASSYWTFFGFMVVNGFAQATGWSSVVGTIGHWTRRRERGWIMGLWGTCYQLGGVLAKGWAGFWLASQGWRGAFFAASSVLLVVWFVVLFHQRNKPEDVGLEPLQDPEVPAKESGRSEWTRQLVSTVMLVGAFYFGVKFVRYALWSWTPFFLQKNFGLAGDEAAYLSTVFDLSGFLGVVVAGFVSDRLFESRRAKVAFFMLVGMVASCALMYTLGAVAVGWFAVTLGFVGFTLYGPDSLMSGAGAIDVGAPRTAIAAAGIINGMGSVGAVVQEMLVAHTYTAGNGALGPVFALLLAASSLSLLALAAVLWRNRLGLSAL